MKVHLQYGRDGLDVEIPSARARVIEPTFVAGLADEAAAFAAAVRAPLGGKPLRACVGARERVAIVIPDVTRPLPTDRLLPWIFAELAHVPANNVVIVNGTGSHRANTPDELGAMVGTEVLARYRVVNHDAHDPSTLVAADSTSDGRPVALARDYVEADRRIVLGFIEPHFMAGFSGGYKGVFPAVADIASIMHYHRAAAIGHPKSTWGVLDGNPTQEQIRRNGALVPVDFLVNVTLNRRRQITRFFCGDVAAAWRPSLARHLRVEHWTSAAGQAATVAHAILGEERPYDDLPYFWSDGFGLRLQHVGHAEEWTSVEIEGGRDSFVARYLDATGVPHAALLANRPREVGLLRRELAGAAQREAA